MPYQLEKRSKEAQYVLDKSPVKIIIWSNVVIVAVAAISSLVFSKVNVPQTIKATFVVSNKVETSGQFMLTTTLGDSLLNTKINAIKTANIELNSDTQSAKLLTCQMDSAYAENGKIILLCTPINSDLRQGDFGQIFMQTGTQNVLSLVIKSIRI